MALTWSVSAIGENLLESQRTRLVQIVPLFVIAFVQLVDLIFGVSDEFESGAFQTDVVRENAFGVYQNPIALTRLNDLNHPKEVLPTGLRGSCGRSIQTNARSQHALFALVPAQLVIAGNDWYCRPTSRAKPPSGSGVRGATADQETYQTNCFSSALPTLLRKSVTKRGA